MGFFSRFFGKKGEPEKKGFSQEEHEADYDNKKAGLEAILGEMHTMVGHAIIPFELGGALDMYYFPKHIAGTGFATMELLDPDGKGPLENRLGTYELLAFTKYDYQTSKEEPMPFNKAEREACGYLTAIGMYSSQAVLNPYETIEVPNGEGEENTCLIFDNYLPDGKAFKVGQRKHHLLLCLRVFRSEMNYAREQGSETLLELLKEKNIYPYGDLDREAVV
ncbi:MAG: suppressor of fused domain protein [Bacteroidota bacterium]